MRSLLLTLHRWIGLPVSLILALTGGTGVVMLFATPPLSLVMRIAGRLHETIGLRGPGGRVVAAATLAAVALELSGLVLWWRRRSLSVSLRGGLHRALFDLHHVAGALGFVMMLLMASAAAAYYYLPLGSLARTVNDLHHGRTYPLPIKVLYALGSAGFVVQGCTGVMMWARRKRFLR